MRGTKPHREANHTLGENLCAAVKLAQPNQQVICLVGDGSFISSAAALRNVA
jgi:thiamine pyrophosphate-dependent acetolactate synthase large subunit-like protein